MSTKVRISDAIRACLLATGEKDDSKGIDILQKNQEGAGQAVALFSVVIASRDQEIESCCFKQLALAAFELSVCAEKGIDADAAIKRAMQEANEKNIKLMREAQAAGHSIVVNSLSTTKDGIIVSTLDPKDLKDA